MKRFYFFVALLVFGNISTAAQQPTRDLHSERVQIESRIPGLKLSINSIISTGLSRARYPVLFLHGASFPGELAFSFKMGGSSWMEFLAMNGYDTYALDFLGFGRSDSYPEMRNADNSGRPLGRASEVYLDVDKAVQYVLKRTGASKVILIGHSWGSTVALLYSSSFPDKIEKLVLFAPLTQRNESIPETSSELFESMVPSRRVEQMAALTPKGEECQLETEVQTNWSSVWLRTSALSTELGISELRIPGGPSADIYDLKTDKPYYDPTKIKVPTLVIRGDWDRYPNQIDGEGLVNKLVKAPDKKYVVIPRGTHVMHLEKNRLELYQKSIEFMNEKENLEPRHSIAVIFEVIPAKGRQEEYLQIAASLREDLQKIPGFISIERFQSLTSPGKILSLSFWENEEAISQWRNLENHRIAQAKGREYVFEDYRLRVAGVIRDYGLHDRNEAPDDSKLRHKKLK